MIAYLHGQLAESTPTHVVVDCHGVGYSVFIPLSSYDKLPPRGGEVKLLTYHHVVAHRANLSSSDRPPRRHRQRDASALITRIPRPHGSPAQLAP